VIRVTLEIVPFGIESLKKTIGKAKIINDGTGTQAVGNYKAINTTPNERMRVWEKGVVKGFPRLDMSIWDLVYLALRDVVGERNDVHESISKIKQEV